MLPVVGSCAGVWQHPVLLLSAVLAGGTMAGYGMAVQALHRPTGRDIARGVSCIGRYAESGSADSLRR